MDNQLVPNFATGQQILAQLQANKSALQAQLKHIDERIEHFSRGKYLESAAVDDP